MKLKQKNRFFSTGLLLFLLIFSFSSCSLFGKKEYMSPEEVTKKFFFYFNMQDFVSAKKYGTAETAKILDMLEEMRDTNDTQIKEEMKLKVLKCEKNGNTAICTISAKGQEQDVPLKKVKGNWLVDLKKES